MDSWLTLMEKQAAATAAVPASTPALTPWNVFMQQNAPKDASGNPLTASSVGSIFGGTGGSVFDKFTAWFNPVRIVTVIIGLTMFAAGILLLGKQSPVQIVKDTIAGA